MSKKLSEQIREFIIEEKRANSKLSCRGLISLIKEKFSIEISKSLINNVIKENNLSSPVGRRRVKEGVTPPEAPAKLPEIKPVMKESGFMENGGFFFLKAADLKLGLTLNLAELLSVHFPGLAKESHQEIIEALIYTPHFKDKRSLWLFIGSEVPEEDLVKYSQQISQIPPFELKEAAAKVGISHKINNINELWEEAILRLSAHIVHFFPSEYQFLDFLAMKERFYSLPAKFERKAGLLSIHLFYPKDFFWLNDIIWQEGFSYAANRVNEAKILSPDKEQIWINPQVKFQ